MSETEKIVCKPTSWVKIRALLILAMLGTFTFLFYKDGTWGYKEKNLQYFVHDLMVNRAPQIAQDPRRGFTQESWEAFAAEQTVPFPDASEGPVPDGAKEMEWPQQLVENFTSVREGNKEAVNLWKSYAEERRWPEEPPEQPYDKGQIDTQFLMASICGGLMVVVLFVFLRILGRRMVATNEGYVSPDGQEIPYENMRRIDKRKWDTKGIATIFYEVDGEEKKAKVDGMVYGQFKREDGEPAERLFDKIMNHFRGEVIEYEEVDEEENGSAV